MEASDDLENWLPMASAFLAGDGGVHSQRVVVPGDPIKAFFRYSMQPRGGGVAGNALTDWDRVYSFNAATFQNTVPDTTLDTDHDGIPDYLEIAFGTDRFNDSSFPWQVVRTDPFTQDVGHRSNSALVVHPRDAAVVVYLNRPLPDSVTSVPAHFVRQQSYIRLPDTLLDILDSASLATGSTMILPGRKAVAFLPSPSLLAGSDHTPVNNYRIDFSTFVTGIPQLLPWHSEFSTVDTFDEVGPWVRMVRPGETAIEVATDFVPVIEWSQPLLPSTVVSGNVTVYEQVSGAIVPVTVYFDYDTNRMTLAHTAPFAPDTAYTVTLGTGFTNLMGKPLLNAFTWSFRTRPLRPQPVAGQGPYVTATFPGDFSTSVTPHDAYVIRVTFSEEMNDSTLSAATVHLRAHGAASDTPFTVSYYNPETRTFTFFPDSELAFGTRYELRLDAASILSSASNPKPVQGQVQFVFTTLSGGGGGMGGPGSGLGGSSGTPDPDQPPPLVLSLSYGDHGDDGNPDGDAGASVRLEITLPDGSQRQQQMPNVTNDYATNNSPEIPAGSTVVVTPQFLKGSDDNVQEERTEVQVEVSGLQVPEGTDYSVFRQGDPPSSADAPVSAAVWDFVGPLVGGAFIAEVKNNGKLAVGKAGFQLRNDSDVVKGWDSTGLEPWTSVNVGQQNNLVKAVFPVAVKYTDYELVVKAGDEGKIGLQNHAITAKITNFTIVGSVADPQGDIQLRKKGATPTVVATLHVHCFTPRVAKIGIYRVFDSANVNTQAPDQGIMADNATIIADLNQTFGLPAGVTFATDASSRRVDMKDTNVFNADGSIDVSFNNGAQLNTIAGVTAILVSQDNKPLPKLRLYLVQSLNGTKEAYGGLTKTNTDVEVDPGSAFANCFVNRSQPSDTVRHEVGHGLGLSQQKQGQANSHDNGKWPVELHPSNGDPKPAGLMNDSANGRAWLRNNDWFWANKTAHYYE